MTVVPEEPVMVLDIVAGPEVVLAGTAITEVLPSVPVMMLEVTETGAVPVDGATPLAAVSLPDKSVVLVSVLMTELVADAEAALAVVKWLERPEFKDDAALDKMLENPDARDSVTEASVAVAATLEKSELSEEAKLDRAADAALVIDPVVVAVGLPLASDSTDDWAEETALANSEAAEETTPVAPAVWDAASEEVPVVSSVPVEGVGRGIGMGRPPVPRMPVEVVASVPFVVSAPSVDEPTNSDAREPIKPGFPVPVLDPDVSVLLAVTTSEVEGTTVPFSVSGAVADKEIGIEAFSAVGVVVVNDADGVVDALPSMIVDRPTVIAPREGKSEASISLELLSEELVPVGAGSELGPKPVVPTFRGPFPDAERVEMAAVELAVGNGRSAGRRPPDAPAKGPKGTMLDGAELVPDSVRVLARVGFARSLAN